MIPLPYEDRLCRDVLKTLAKWKQHFKTALFFNQNFQFLPNLVGDMSFNRNRNFVYFSPRFHDRGGRSWEAVETSPAHCDAIFFYPVLSPWISRLWPLSPQYFWRSCVLYDFRLIWNSSEPHGFASYRRQSQPGYQLYSLFYGKKNITKGIWHRGD